MCQYAVLVGRNLNAILFAEVFIAFLNLMPKIIIILCMDSPKYPAFISILRLLVQLVSIKN